MIPLGLSEEVREVCLDTLGSLNAASDPASEPTEDGNERMLFESAAEVVGEGGKVACCGTCPEIRGLSKTLPSRKRERLLSLPVESVKALSSLVPVVVYKDSLVVECEAVTEWLRFASDGVGGNGPPGSGRAGGSLTPCLRGVTDQGGGANCWNVAIAGVGGDGRNEDVSAGLSAVVGRSRLSP